MIGRAIEEAIGRIVVIVAIAGVAFGVISALLLPKLWDIVKPMLHALTA